MASWACHGHAMVMPLEILMFHQSTLTFSHGWLQKFKKHNGIRQEKLDGEEASADHNAIAECLPLLQDKCSRYSPDRIYNMDETGLFYWLEPDQTLVTQRLA